MRVAGLRPQERTRLHGGFALRKVAEQALPGLASTRLVAQVALTEPDLEQRIGTLGDPGTSGATFWNSASAWR
jgi:hypothetical protein